MPSQARRRSPGSVGFREVFKDKSIHRIKVIFWALISSQTLISKYHLVHSVLSALFISKINTFFPGQIGVLYSPCFARSPPHLSECERFEGRDKRYFSNQPFFLKHFCLFLKLFFIIYKCSEGATELIPFIRPDMRPMELAELIR